MAKSKTASPEAGAENTTPVVYCGPTLPKAQLTTMSVYRGGLPKRIRALIAATPEIGELIVPVDRLPEMRRLTRTPGTEEHRLYGAVIASRGGE